MRSPRGAAAFRQRRGTGAGLVRPADRRSRPLCRDAGAADARRAAALRHRAAARRLWPRRDRHLGRGSADQDRRQSAPSGEPRLDRRIRRSGGAVALRPDRSQAPRSGGRIQSWSAFEAALRATDRSGSFAPRRRPCAADRPRHLADAAPADRRSHAKLSGSEVVSLRAGRGRRRARRRRAGVRPAVDGHCRASPMRAWCCRSTPIRSARPRADPVRPRHFAARQSHTPERFAAALCGRAVMDADRRLRRSPPGAAAIISSATSRWRLPARLAPLGRRPHCRPMWRQFARSAAADLRRSSAPRWCWPGRDSRAEVHALCHWINAQLEAPVDYHRAGRSGRDRARGIAAQSGRRHSRQAASKR